MKEERGRIAGDIAVNEPMNLWGTIGGSVTVNDGGKLYVRGLICGDLIVREGGRCHVFGNVAGDLVVHEGAKVIHSGMIGGDAINRGGRLFIEISGRVVGKIKQKAGETARETKDGKWTKNVPEMLPD